jgi:hypothetical protein
MEHAIEARDVKSYSYIYTETIFTPNPPLLATVLALDRPPGYAPAARRMVQGRAKGE